LLGHESLKSVSLTAVYPKHETKPDGNEVLVRT